jgi:hypothetical protein
VGLDAPHNLLLVGGPDRFPFDVQRALDQLFRTGRLDTGIRDGTFDWDGCAAYAEKVTRYEARASTMERRALLYSFAIDGPTRVAHAELSTPLQAYLASPQARRDWLVATDPPVTLFHGDALTARLTATLGATRPAVVFTVSHGVEDPVDASDWGALTDVTCTAPSGASRLASSSVTGLPAFAEGAVFFAFACFSAGIPARSIFAPAGANGTRPTIAGAPCTSPLAQSLLRHPRGPIAFVGHVDRVTSRSFTDAPDGKGMDPFTNIFDWFLGGSGTLGQAMSILHERGKDSLGRLVFMTSPFAARRRPPSEADFIDLWQRYYDYSGFLLLGDPALELCA